MAKLYLLRHLKSQWNLENRFAGWVDNPLSKEGADQAKDVASKIVGENFDVVYSSALIRNVQTVIKILRNLGDKYPIFIHLDGGKMQKWGNFEGGGNYVPVYTSEKLNERYYGNLQGLNKNETVEKFGGELVHNWRRSYKIVIPGGETMENTFKRAVPFYKKNIEKDLKAGKNVLVVASHNSLRAIVKYLENIPDDKIAELELPFGALIKYDFEDGKYKKLV
ncbi:MAG: histidine phosphatase family protein [Candidatus Staskawiczbacteria bacterium]|jgi:2,3-bisphosphoglycerate-dependent phosphoglycerate mutase